MDNITVDEMYLMQNSKIKTAVHLDELGIWSFEFRVIERANDETWNVHELCLDVQDLCTILQLGLDTMGRRAVRKKSSCEAQEKVVTIVNCWEKS